LSDDPIEATRRGGLIKPEIAGSQRWFRPGQPRQGARSMYTLLLTMKCLLIVLICSICALIGAFSLIKIPFDLYTMLKDKKVNMSSENDDDGPYWHWPSDKWKLSARLAGLFITSGVFIYFCALESQNLILLLQEF
jgi:hypothetical protein